MSTKLGRRFSFTTTSMVMLAAGLNASRAGAQQVDAQPAGPAIPAADAHHEDPAPQQDAAQASEKSASPTAGTPSSAGEIIITAQKRAQRLVDVPISVVALTGQELQKKHVTDIDNLQFLVPSIKIDTTGWQRRLSLRGVLNGVGEQPSVGEYLDEADITTDAKSVPSVNIFDLERVEVLRGPQGTIYGQGSMGGTIRFITRDPDLSRFGFESDFTGSFTAHGSPSGLFDAVVNAPVSDTLGFRIAGQLSHDGGWIDQPAANRKDINSQNLVDVRAKGLWKPAPDLTISTLVEVHHNRTAPGTGETVPYEYTQTFSLTTTPSTIDKFQLYNVTAKYNFAGMQLLDTATYMNQRVNTSDYGYILQFGLLDPIFNPPYDVLQLHYNLHNKAFTNELRLSSANSGPWQWTIGGSYRHAKLGTDQAYIFGCNGNVWVNFYLPQYCPKVVPNVPTLQVYNTDSHSFSLFADTHYELLDRLTLGAGIRYFHDKQLFTNLGTADQRATFHSVDPRFYGLFKVNKNINLYVNVAKGFRSGGFNTDPEFPAYKPETLWTYEGGVKWSYLGGRIAGDAALFRSDYTNLQRLGVVFIPGPPGTPPPGIPENAFTNVGKIRITGAEWDFRAQLPQGWSVSFNGNYFFGDKLLSSEDPNNPVIGGRVTVPKIQINASLEKDFVLLGKDALIRVDYSHQGKTPDPGPPFGVGIREDGPAINLINLDAELRVSDQLSFAVFVQNLLNQRKYLGPTWDFDHNVQRTKPLTAGFQVRTQF